jgi:hypothetical protein
MKSEKQSRAWYKSFPERWEHMLGKITMILPDEEIEQLINANTIFEAASDGGFDRCPGYHRSDGSRPLIKPSSHEDEDQCKLTHCWRNLFDLKGTERHPWDYFYEISSKNSISQHRNTDGSYTSTTNP